MVIAEVILRISALPEQKARESDLSAGSDDQVGVGHSSGVKIGGEGFGGEIAQSLLEAAFRIVVLHITAKGIRDLFAPTISDGDVEYETVVMFGGFFGVLDGLLEAVGQEV